MSILHKSDSIQIREVWADNLDREFSLIRGIVDDYPYIAMDTEFPGVVLRPVGNFKNPNDYHFQTLKDNVDMLNLIQLGFTFSDDKGNLPTCGSDKCCVWQFNFREFNPNEDVFANDSIELLRQCGIDFVKNNEKGIDAKHFGELLMSSGIVLNDDVYWVTFHSGYDFGYLLKLLTCKKLPDTQEGFFKLINMYFPKLYDIKHLMKFCNSLHGGLNKLAELLEVERVGISHQAGSDSLLTACTFKKLKENFFSSSLEKYSGVLYGLGLFPFLPFFVSDSGWPYNQAPFNHVTFMFYNIPEWNYVKPYDRAPRSGQFKQSKRQVSKSPRRRKLFPRNYHHRFTRPRVLCTGFQLTQHKYIYVNHFSAVLRKELWNLSWL
ncbi:unnamed protein product [Fraxinus pennsylvanica]|uniref:poly(A)-specific ribonuclease n=1 Tax=Fraxinus pennsylvanica TaxID=56036 RepID=A0AAD1YNG9_9LAMI|nr:unnamed protein product [Fraxinus pennsylvanica]